MSSLTAREWKIGLQEADARGMDDNTPWYQDFDHLGGVDLTLWVKLLTALVALVALAVTLL